MTTAKKRKRRQRRRGDLPAGFMWRAGRPRWNPSPSRRKAGWRGCDLKDAWGNWLPRGPAIERAQALADAAKALTQGEAVPAALAPYAPRQSAISSRSAVAGNPRAIGALMDDYLAAMTVARGRKGPLAPRTLADYRSKLGRFLTVLAGSEAKVPHVRGLDIDLLTPPRFDEARPFRLEEAYETLRAQAGEAMAAGVMACVSAWLGWCVKKRRVWPTNPAALVERGAPAGRIEVWDWPELVALVAAAEALGRASIADAVVLAVDLSWSQQDLLALTWGQVNDDRVRHRRIKTGVAGNPPLLSIGRARLETIRRRQDNVRPLHILISELTGKPWAADTFRHEFARVRAEAAKALPAVAFKQFRDLRDTAVTYAYEAGLTVPEICSRTLHAPTRAQAVIEKHYGAIRQQVADGAAAKLDAHFAAMGYSFAGEETG